MTPPQEKAHELYGRYLTGYMRLTDTITARVKSKECVNHLCDAMIDELITFGNGDNDTLVYTIGYWHEVKTETNNIPI